MLKVTVYSTDLDRFDEGVKVLVVADPESLEVTVPETELLDASLRVKVLLVIVVLSINSENVADMVETTVVAPSVGEVEEIVGAVVSTVNEVKVMVFPVFPARSVIVTVQSE